MKLVTAEERKRLTRAAWAYSGLDQQQVAEKTGIPYGTLKGLLRPSGAEPTTEQARAIAITCGAPVWLVDYGWPTAAMPTELAEGIEPRITELEEHVTQLREAVAALAERPSGSAADATSTQAQPGTAHRQAPAATAR